MTHYQASAVIGANYGDEGKGATTHVQTWQLMQDQSPAVRRAPLVVRFNGGAQAGHTVQTVDGKRRIFSQLGSGSFLGAGTYLSEHFLFNPVTFVREMQDWIIKECPFGTAFPQVWIHPQAKVVTPWDIALNQAAEQYLEHKKGGAHGSCGHGIGATMKRHLQGVTLVYQDLVDPTSLVTSLRAIEDLYNFNIARVGALGIHPSDPVVVQFLQSIKLCQRWIEIADYRQLPKNNVVFEGAQGLLLDQDNKEHFPHVTYSKPGVTNVVDIIKKMRAANWDISLDYVWYCTRPYLIRHGNGPMHAAQGGLECSSSELELIDFKDDTNVTNPWQGSLRFGKMDWDKFNARILKDWRQTSGVNGEDKLNPPIGLSAICHDQVIPAMWDEMVSKTNSFILDINGQKLQTTFNKQ